MDKNYDVFDGLKIAQEIANVHGGKFLETRWHRTRHKYKWQCSEGHMWFAIFSNVAGKKQTWCPVCALNNRRLDGLNIAFKIAIENEGICKSSSYTNNQTPLEWECKNGHTWCASLGNVISQKSWCPKCANVSRLCIDNCHIIADIYGGQCKSEVYVNSKTAYTWECKMGHVWKTSYHEIKQGSWCPYCSGKADHTIEDCHALDNLQGGQFLSTEYSGNKVKYSWECSNNHTWKASYNTIQGGSWCPCCKSISKKQKLLFDILKDIFPVFNIEYNFRGFEWLTSNKSGKKQELDIYIADIKLAIEYDGLQHFKPIKYFGGKKAWENLKRLDKLKNKKILRHPNDISVFIRIPYTEQITKENILRILSVYGVPL